MNPSKESPNDPNIVALGFWIDRAPLLAATVAPLSVLLSLSFDWGFLAALGFGFVESPITLTDHLGSWLEWLPWMAITAILVTLYELVSQRLERGMTEQEIVETSWDPTRSHKLREGYITLFKWLGPVILVNYLVLGAWVPVSMVALGIALTCYSVSGFIFGIPRMTNRYPLFFRRSFVAVVVGLPLLFYLGYQEAERRLTNTGFSYEISYNNENIPKGLDKVQLLRTFERWLVVRDASTAITWVALKDVSRIEFRDKGVKYDGLLCIFFERLC